MLDPSMQAWEAIGFDKLISHQLFHKLQHMNNHSKNEVSLANSIKKSSSGWPKLSYQAKEEEEEEMVSVSGICTKRVAVRARHHILGRLASISAKELLNGQKVVVVRCEEICMWSGLVSQKMNLMRFLRKRLNTKPSHGLIQFPAPLTSSGVPFVG
ncbi:hypothetical protein J1N35_013177 [Gossypium stocksii]|uniref:Uncharacterized protein n=1 Tax=Gossypium stocksii TaxID=47602 RepID=A0A9D3VUH3_9ROSI|nr:hypothetical protein J1N35_013177 [Gossypium stocksii]